jgi:hypothetical protein
MAVCLFTIVSVETTEYVPTHCLMKQRDLSVTQAVQKQSRKAEFEIFHPLLLISKPIACRISTSAQQLFFPFQVCVTITYTIHLTLLTDHLVP